MRKRNFTTVVLGSLLVAITGCGPASAHKIPNTWPELKVQIKSVAGLDVAPLNLAQKLGFFQQNHLRVTTTQKAESLSIGPAGSTWPLIGYLTTRPDMVLVSESPDPAFRLRALNHLPMMVSQSLASQRNLAQDIFSAHHAQITQWSELSNKEIQILWRRRHLPWVLVTMEQAERLKAISPHTAILAWMGASTGPIPSVAIASTKVDSQVVHFLDALNLALWYLHTTPSKTIAQTLGVSQGLVKKALRYQFWPLTTFPDGAAYTRGRLPWHPGWPFYERGVNTDAGRRALSGPSE